MASSIAALTAGGGGVVTTADSSGNLNLISGTTTVLALTATGIAVTGTLSASGVTTHAAGSAALPSITTTGDTDTGVWFPAANTLAASTGGVEAMRIDSSGNLLVGTTSVTAGCKVNISGYDGAASQSGMIFKPSTATLTNYLIFYNSAAGLAGYINQTGTTTVSYGTSSDYRLKENVQPIPNALDRVLSLKPVIYSWKNTDGELGEGFLAHELQEVCPLAVTGTKDDINEDGSIKSQGVDYSKIVALLTASIQEQQALIIQLQADVAALKGVKA